MARPRAAVGPPREPSGGSDRRQRLEALRDALAGRLDGAADRDLAALAGRYAAVLKELDELAVPQEGSAVDDLTARRAARRAAASDS